METANSMPYRLHRQGLFMNMCSTLFHHLNHNRRARSVLYQYYLSMAMVVQHTLEPTNVPEIKLLQCSITEYVYYYIDFGDGHKVELI
jgi:hypothetical protein